MKTKNKIQLFLLLALFTVFTKSAMAETNIPLSSDKYEYAAKVVRVVDGDTYDVVVDLGFDLTMNTSVRVRGLDTPETRATTPLQKAAGTAAKEFAIRELTDKDITITSVTHEKYHRWLATVWYNKEVVAEDGTKSIQKVKIKDVMRENGFQKKSSYGDEK